MNEFVVYIDACMEGLGGVLLQEGLVVACKFWKRKEHEEKYVTQDLELATIVHALKIWHYYLLGRPFKLRTDKHNLQYLFTQPFLHARQHRWMEFLVEYDMKIAYIKLKENKVIDALSRKRHKIPFLAINQTLKIYFSILKSWHFLH